MIDRAGQIWKFDQGRGTASFAFVVVSTSRPQNRSSLNFVYDIVTLRSGKSKVKLEVNGWPLENLGYYRRLA